MRIAARVNDLGDQLRRRDGFLSEGDIGRILIAAAGGR